MGLLDFASKVVTTYKADTKDHVKELEKLKGAEKERAKEAIEGGKKLEKSLEDQLKAFGKLTIGIGAAAGAVSAFVSGFNEHMEHGRLVAAAQGADIEKLKKASFGLKNEMNLLRDAAAYQSGAFKLNQKQMEDTERAMVALTRKGKDAAKVHDAILQAVTALKTEGLADLGIFIDKAGASMETADGRAKIFERTMAALAETSKEAGNSQASAEEKIVAVGVSLQDSWSKLKRSLGELVVAMEPLLTQLAKAVSLVADLANKGTGRISTETRTGGGLWGMASVTTEANKAMAGAGASLNMLDAMAGGNSGIEGAGRSEFDRLSGDSGVVRDSMGFGGMTKGQFDEIERLNAKDAAEKAAAKRLWEAGAGKRAQAIAARIFASFIFSEGRNLARSFDVDDTGTVGQDVDSSGWGTLGAKAGESDADIGQLLRNQLGEKLTGRWNDKFAARDKQQSKLAEIFGPLEEFNAYTTAWTMLSGAVSSSFGAWIDGSMGAGQAAKKFIAESLKGLAMEGIVNTAKYLALAASYAVTPGMQFWVPGALKAAALWGGVTIAAGAGARALGGGGGGGGGAAASPGGGRGAGAAPPTYAPDRERASGSQGVVVIGHAFAADSPRARRRQAQELVGIATRGAGEVVYS